MQSLVYLAGFAVAVYLSSQVSDVGEEWGPIMGYMIGLMTAALAAADSNKTGG